MQTDRKRGIAIPFGKPPSAKLGRWRAPVWAMLLAALCLVTLLIHGYHPFAEDGGLYAAGIEYTHDPSLFPHYTAFVTEHLSFSLFAPATAALIHTLHLPLDAALLLVDLFSLALTFFAAHQLLRRCIASEAAQLGGLALLATWWTIPVAGTSLLLMDPYVTARSLSTPLTLLAIAFALDDWHTTKNRVPHPFSPFEKGWSAFFNSPTGSAATCIASLIFAALFHPLMATYAATFVITLRLTRVWKKRTALPALTLAALFLGAILHAAAPTDSPAVIAAAISRYYWFLSQWQWYELLGLAGPLILLALLLHYRRHNLTTAAATLLRATLFLGLLATLIALLFCHQDDRAHLVARLQPLRIFLPVYAIMTLLLGATLTDALVALRARTLSSALRHTFIALAVLIFAALAGVFFYVQRSTFPASPHLELPSHEASNHNPWVQAFLWARANTPPDALFALDAKYVNQDGEDAQTFRAWSLRSALPDFSKDGGEAAITPSLAGVWLSAADAQRNLSTENDATRDPRILPLGATWMIAHADTPTSHACPYVNSTVKVCHLIP